MPKRKSESNGKQTDPSNEEEKKPKEKKKAEKNENSECTWKNENFECEAKTKDGELNNLKFASWNVNGIRAWLQKGSNEYITKENPDIIGLQETKCSPGKIPPDVVPEGYHAYWVAGDKEGYAGVGLLSKIEPIEVEYGLGLEEHDSEGRVITAEYENFYFVTTYVPNAGKGLVRHDYRTKKWDKEFREYLQKLDEKKPVIMCGDLNVAHFEIDLKNPKANKKNAGFTPEEREGFSELLNAGFSDTFRELYPDKEGSYTFWTYMSNARGKDIGWRLDYFVISKRILSGLCDNIIRKSVIGSDHCPVVLLMHL